VTILKQTTFGDLFNISSSKRVLERDWKDSGIPFYRAREIVKLSKEGHVHNELFISKDHYDSLKKEYGVPKEGDLMVSAVGTLGACYIVKSTDCFYFKDASVLRFSPKSGEVCSKYIQHAFNTSEIQDQIHAGGSSTVGTYTIERAKKTKISLPPLAQQQRITAILDKAQHLRRMRELAVKKIGTLSKEIFIGMFSDLLEKPNTTLGSVFDVRDGTHESPKSQTEGYPLITSKNLTNNIINLEDVSFINLKDFVAINKRSKVDYSDILMPMIGTIGNPVIVHDKNPQFAIKNVALIKTGNMEASFYVKGLLETHYFERYVSKESKGGTQKFLSLGNIRNFPIYVPSDEQLQKFSKISNALIQAQFSLVKSQRKLDELLFSLQFSLMTSN
jgi:type I restriction enzyme S subunit